MSSTPCIVPPSTGDADTSPPTDDCNYLWIDSEQDRLRANAEDAEAWLASPKRFLKAFISAKNEHPSAEAKELHDFLLSNSQTRNPDSLTAGARNIAIDYSAWQGAEFRQEGPYLTDSSGLVERNRQMLRQNAPSSADRSPNTPNLSQQPRAEENATSECPAQDSSTSDVPAARCPAQVHTASRPSEPVNSGLKSRDYRETQEGHYALSGSENREQATVAESSSTEGLSTPERAVVLLDVCPAIQINQTLPETPRSVHSSGRIVLRFENVDAEGAIAAIKTIPQHHANSLAQILTEHRNSDSVIDASQPILANAPSIKTFTYRFSIPYIFSRLEDEAPARESRSGVSINESGRRPTVCSMASGGRSQSGIRFLDPLSSSSGVKTILYQGMISFLVVGMRRDVYRVYFFASSNLDGHVDIDQSEDAEYDLDCPGEDEDQIWESWKAGHLPDLLPDDPSELFMKLTTVYLTDIRREESQACQALRRHVIDLNLALLSTQQQGGASGRSQQSSPSVEYLRLQIATVTHTVSELSSTIDKQVRACKRFQPRCASILRDVEKGVFNGVQEHMFANNMSEFSDLRDLVEEVQKLCEKANDALNKCLDHQHGKNAERTSRVGLIAVLCVPTALTFTLYSTEPATMAKVLPFLPLTFWALIAVNLVLTTAALLSCIALDIVDLPIWLVRALSTGGHKIWTYGSIVGAALHCRCRTNIVGDLEMGSPYHRGRTRPESFE